MIVQCKVEDVEKNGYTLRDTETHRLTNMQHTDPAQYTVLGWVKISKTNIVFYLLFKRR